jgi:hypothetical protein
MSYADVQAALHGRQRKKIGNHTYLEKVGEEIHYILWGTSVAIFTPNKIKLYAGGYQTSTTKDRINKALALAVDTDPKPYVFQEDWQWYLQTVVGKSAGATEFSEGISLNYNGEEIKKNTLLQYA